MPSLAGSPGRKPGKPVSGDGEQEWGTTEQAGGKKGAAGVAKALLLPRGGLLRRC